MMEIEKSVIRMECAVERIERTVDRFEAVCVDVEIMKKQGRYETVKNLIHYALTTAAVGLGIKSNV